MHRCRHGIAEPTARSRLQYLAREIGDAIFGFSDKYPDTVISPPREDKVQKVKGLALKVEGLSNLPAADERFFGREEVLARLDNAWNTVTPENKINIISVVAWGGVGKSALVSRWLKEMGEAHYHGAQRVFCWSFAGEEAGQAATVENFLSAAFAFFGESKPTMAFPGEIGGVLAGLVSAERTLLILDNLEAVQSPPGDGHLRDTDVQILLDKLAGNNSGLCLITTRQRIIELSHYSRTVKQIALGDLSEEIGSQLLRALGVKGNDKDLRAAVQESHGNALILKLLGAYLRDHYEGDIKRRREADLVDSTLPEGDHARRIVEAHARTG